MAFRVFTQVVSIVATLLIAMSSHSQATDTETIISPEQAAARALSTIGEIGPNDFRISNSAQPYGRYDALMPAVSYDYVRRQYLVVWAGNDNTAGPTPTDIEIFGRRFDAQTGDAIDSSEFLISDMGPNGDSAYLATRPSVAFNAAADEFLVVWAGVDQSAGEYEIYGQRINAVSGAAVGTNDFRISDMGGDNVPPFGAFAPKVVHNTIDNEYLVVWEVAPSAVRI